MNNKKDAGWIEGVMQNIVGIDFDSELVDKSMLESKLIDSMGKLEIGELQLLSLYYSENLTIEEICEVLSIEELEMYSVMDAIAAKLKVGLIDKYCLATHGFY